MGSSKVRVRAVCDTNVVVSALLFAKGRLGWLREAWREGVVVPLLSQATVAELMRVLAYPKFKLSHSDIEELLSDYLPYGEVVEVNAVTEDLPSCRDADDQIFVELAFAGKADMLITGDADLLAMAASCPFSILPPTEVGRTLSGG